MLDVLVCIQQHRDIAVQGIVWRSDDCQHAAGNLRNRPTYMRHGRTEIYQASGIEFDICPIAAIRAANPNCQTEVDPDR
jgi:hypothetical protein